MGAEFPVTWSRLHADRTLGPAFTTTTFSAAPDGISMVTSEPVWQGERMRVEVRFGPPPIVARCDATVTRVETPSRDRWACSVRFDNLDRDVEQQIVQWMFSRERAAADRRSSVRIPLEMLVTCWELDLLGKPSTEAFRAATVDVAGDGVRLQMERELDVGQLLAIEMRLGDPPAPIAVRGRIVWARPTHPGWQAYGVHFEDIDARTHRLISERAYAHQTSPARRSHG
jgi:c-di-GMP-binding flagellar brake protein YcgR